MTHPMRTQKSHAEDLSASFDDLFYSIERPIDFFARYDERGSDANNSVVSFLAQNAFFLERLAIGPRQVLQLDSNPQALATHLAQVGAAKSLEAFEEVASHRGGVLDHFFFDQHAQSRLRHGATEGIAAERAAVVARLVNA